MARMPALQVAKLSKMFGNFAAVNDVSFSVTAGEVRAIIGPNGAGKTTLVNVVSGLIPPTAGCVALHGEDVTGSPPHRMARAGLVRTFQITNVVPEMTVEENVLVAALAGERSGAPQRPQRSGRTFWRRRDMGGVHARREDLVNTFGLRGVATTRTEELSHGDLRLLEICMAIATSPRVVLLDEPTAGMSRFETRRIVEMVNGTLKGRVTVIIIEHDMEVVMRTADRITVLAQGQVLVEGTPAEVRGNPQAREVYFG